MIKQCEISITVCITNCTKPKKKRLSELRFLAPLGKILCRWDGV